MTAALLLSAAFPSFADEFKGAGAALCIAAGELLSQQPNPDASLRDGLPAWRQILHVVDGTDVQRQEALDGARASLAKHANAKRGPNVAAISWSAGCAARDMQIKYLMAHASAARTNAHLAEEPGTELDAEAAGRLNDSALCLASAEAFLTPPRALRSALDDVSPAAPDAATLRGIRDRARQDIDAAPGSVAGKALVIDYFRQLTTRALTTQPERFLNRTSQRLHERCPSPRS